MKALVHSHRPPEYVEGPTHRPIGYVEGPREDWKFKKSVSVNG